MSASVDAGQSGLTSSEKNQPRCPARCAVAAGVDTRARRMFGTAMVSLRAEVRVVDGESHARFAIVVSL